MPFINIPLSAYLAVSNKYFTTYNFWSTSLVNTKCKLFTIQRVILHCSDRKTSEMIANTNRKQNQFPSYKFCCNTWFCLSSHIMAKLVSLLQVIYLPFHVLFVIIYMRMNLYTYLVQIYRVYALFPSSCF